MKLVKKNKKSFFEESKGKNSRKDVEHLDKREEKMRNKGSSMGNFLQDKWFPQSK